MIRVYIPTTVSLMNFSFAVRVFLEDSRRLIKENEETYAEYIKNPFPENPALFNARAKFIEQCVLLGVIAEYLLKGILLKHGCVINKPQRGKEIPEKFDRRLKNMIKRYDERGVPDQEANLAIYEYAERYLSQASNQTIGLSKCAKLFASEIAKDQDAYFEDLPNKEYRVPSTETAEFYGDVIRYSNAFEKIIFVRNNYVHVPEPMSEVRAIPLFLSDFLLFIAGKEFPSVMKGLEYLR